MHRLIWFGTWFDLFVSFQFIFSDGDSCMFSKECREEKSVPSLLNFCGNALFNAHSHAFLIASKYLWRRDAIKWGQFE